jgi:hypothetical protein
MALVLPRVVRFIFCALLTNVVTSALLPRAVPTCGYRVRYQRALTSALLPRAVTKERANNAR